MAATGLTPVASAQPTLAPNERGDLALVPYYTVLDEWITGLHIVNTSARTQVVKLRFRRATDAMDALDFNLVLSPHDVGAPRSSAGRPWAPTLGAAGKPLSNPQCPQVSTPATAGARDAASNPAGACDYRDLPVALHITAYNREAFAGPVAAGELVVSPAVPSLPD